MSTTTESVRNFSESDPRFTWVLVHDLRKVLEAHGFSTANLQGGPFLLAAWRLVCVLRQGERLQVAAVDETRPRAARERRNCRIIWNDKRGHINGAS